MTELEAAEVIIDEAKSIVQDELGGIRIQWKLKNSQDDSKNSNQNNSVLVSPHSAQISVNSSKADVSINSHLDNTDQSNSALVNNLITPKQLNDKRNVSGIGSRRSLLVKSKRQSGRRCSLGKKSFESLKNVSKENLMSPAAIVKVVSPPLVTGRKSSGSVLKSLQSNTKVVSPPTMSPPGINSCSSVLNSQQSDTCTNTDKENLRFCQIMPSKSEEVIQQPSENHSEKCLKNNLSVKADIHKSDTLLSPKLTENNKKLEIDKDKFQKNNNEILVENVLDGKECKKIIDTISNETKGQEINTVKTKMSEISKTGVEFSNENIKNQHLENLTAKHNQNQEEKLREILKLDVSCDILDSQFDFSPDHLNIESVNQHKFEITSSELTVDKKNIIRDLEEQTGSSGNSKGEVEGDFITCEKKVMDEFIDSFLIDTQTDFIVNNNSVTEKCVENEKNELDCKTINDADIKCTTGVSPSLYTEDFSFQDSINENLSKGDNSKTKNDRPIESTVVINEAVRNNSDQVQACNLNSDTITVKSCDISHDSSDDLIAASNFERCEDDGGVLSGRFAYEDGVLDDSVTRSFQDNSYRDLHIPYQSGQEACFVDNPRTHTQNRKRHDSESDYKNLQEDLALALNMSDSFSCSVHHVAEMRPIDNCVKDSEKIRTDNDFGKRAEREVGKVRVDSDCKNNLEQLSDSLTLSMIENVLDKENTVIENKDSKIQQGVGNIENVKMLTKPKQQEGVKNEKSEVGNKDKKLLRINGKNTSELKFAKNTKVASKSKRLSPGTLAFLDDMCNSSVVEIGNYNREEKVLNKLDNNMDTEAGISHVENVANSKGLQHNSDQSKKRSKILPTNNPSAVSGVPMATENSPNDWLPPTPPDNKMKCMSPQLTFKKPTPNKTTTTIKKKLMGSQLMSKKPSPNRNTATKRNLVSSERSKVTTTIKNNYEDKSSKIPSVKNDDMNSVEHVNGETDMESEDYEGRPPCIDPNESGIPLTQGSFTIIDVCADKRLFDTFIEEWKCQSYYSVSVACEAKQVEMPVGSGIGGNFVKG
ncbi:hypothetical protein KUTeg_007440 [Tegillarca granosa]|uniref:Uncharacterized protein n=1 Tax=Tegillarca granosa TaxID=220873 RepID=A0ABQ9FDA2_TEGGR|nr:hypothetical protein KUTeg_007440 [Tegillarca granosa]